MKRNKEIEMMSGCSFEENTYANVDDFNLKRKKNAPKAKEIPAAKNTQHRVILILGILLILVFITLVTITTFLFISYKSVGEEMSQMRNDSLSSDVQSIRGAVRNLEKVQTASTSFSSDIQRILGFLGKVAEELQKTKSSSNPLCSEGWNHYGLSCYYFSSDKKTWNASKKDCEDKEAHLVVINGKEEMNFLKNSLRGIANKQFFWVGLTDADGTWRWVDGTPYDITPKFWRNSQPDDWKGHGLGGGEDCGMLWHEYDWNDGHCSEKIKYICEKKMTF
ncbi:C-type lectin domain family 10 member A-like [Aquarana catesbeiana]|uniref:C-type lectin domain family 10 member A-like n=1 Tax=Aquarana catesbeiana TaxID=8400 RepID=UPI003CC9D324